MFGLPLLLTACAMGEVAALADWAPLQGQGATGVSTDAAGSEPEPPSASSGGGGGDAAVAEQVTGLAEQLAALQEEVAKLRAAVSPDAFYVVEVDGNLADGSIEIACDKETDVLLSYDCIVTDNGFCPIGRLRSAEFELGGGMLAWETYGGNSDFTLAARCLAVEE